MAKLYTDVELRDPARLTPYPHNTKRHPQDQIDRLADQIAAHGFDQPIVVDREGVIVKGHGRREAALQLGLPEVPVVVSGLDERQAAAARIADNQLVSLDYDTRHLERELGRLRAEEVDLSLTGMDDAQVDRLLRGEGREDLRSAEVPSAQAPTADAGPAPPPPDGDAAPRAPAEAGEARPELHAFVTVGGRKVPASHEEVEGLLESLRDYQADHGTSFGFWTSLLR